ncbi:MAG: adenylate kinase [Planctomycetota bacterium]
MRVLLLGGPGAGKGTQAKRLAETLRVPHISTGDMFRKALGEKTPMGLKAKSYMERGELVPDDVVVGVVEERLRASDVRRGYILDGFPRTLPQAEALKSLLQEKGEKLDRVVLIEVDEAKLVKRLSGRRTCRKCGAMFHIDFNPPKKSAICDSCGGELYQRDDDKEETIRDRQRVYREQTTPLIAFYTRDGILKRVEGEGSIDQVFARIEAALR